MFEGSQENVQDNKSSSYPVFELPGVNCIAMTSLFWRTVKNLSNIHFK